MSHIDRVIDEKAALDQNLGALNAFLAKDKPSHIDNENWALLEDQRRIMSEYSDILGKRLALAAK